MEEVGKDSGFVLSEGKEANSRVFTQQFETDPGVEVSEEALENLSQEAKMSPQRITDLERHLTTLVTNIQTAADARESARRKELEKARKNRLERLEDDVNSSQEKFEEVIKGWSAAKEKVIPQELQEALARQQQLCTLLLENKRKLINDLQQELKVGDDRFVKDLRKQAEELDLMMERMEDQIKSLTKAYREELAHNERIHQQETENLLNRDKSEWDQLMRELWGKELETLEQRRKSVAECEAKVHSLMLETMDHQNMFKTEQNAKLQVLEREHQKILATNMIRTLKRIQQKHDLEEHRINQDHMNSRIMSLQEEMKNLVTKHTSQMKQSSKINQSLSNGYKRNVQQYAQIQKKVKQSAATDAGRFEEMWQTMDFEVKQLVKRALEIDSLICRQHLGIAWEQPPVASRAFSCPVQSESESHMSVRQAISKMFDTEQVLHCGQWAKDVSDGQRSAADAESADVDVCEEGTAARSESYVAMEEGKRSMQALMKVMQPLCDEVGFLMEDNLSDLLAHLEKDEQTAVKLASLLCALGIEEEDLPKLADFLFKYKQLSVETGGSVQEEREGVCYDQTSEMKTSSLTNLTPDVILPNHILPALNSFLKQNVMVSEIIGHHQSCVLQVDSHGSSEDKAYWKSMGNIISQDKVKLWEAAETTLLQQLAVLTEISELVPETETLKKQNAELQMLLEKSVNFP